MAGLALAAITSLVLGGCADEVHPAQVDCEKIVKKRALLVGAPLTVLAVVKGEAEAVLSSKAAADASAEQAPACVTVRAFVDEVTDMEREKRLLGELVNDRDVAKAARASASRVAVQIDGLCRSECESKTATVGKCERKCGCAARSTSSGWTFDCPNSRAKRCKKRCKNPSERLLKKKWDTCMDGCEKRALGDSASETSPGGKVAGFLAALDKLRSVKGPLDSVATLNARIARATGEKYPEAKKSLPQPFLDLSSKCCPQRRKKRDDGLCLAHTDYRYLHCLLVESGQTKLDPSICCEMCHGAKKGDACDIRGTRETCYLECVSDARRR